MAVHALVSKARARYIRLRSDRAFRIICWCGLVGVLVDLDHIVAWTLNYTQGTNLEGRFLHTPLLITSGLIILGVCAYIAGLHVTLVLRRRNQATKTPKENW